jgi:hypothetical protein
MFEALYQLHRTVYNTDYDPNEPEYPGNFSYPMPSEEKAGRIVAVDWSTPGQVTVTRLTVNSVAVGIRS